MVNATVDDNHASYPDIKPGDYVQLTINDSSKGMTTVQIEYILEPFYTFKGQGKGIVRGLAMVFGFIQLSKGYIVVDSEKDVASTFYLYLPRTNKKYRGYMHPWMNP